MDGNTAVRTCQTDKYHNWRLPFLLIIWVEQEISNRITDVFLESSILVTLQFDIQHPPHMFWMSSDVVRHLTPGRVVDETNI